MILDVRTLESSNFYLDARSNLKFNDQCLTFNDGNIVFEETTWDGIENIYCDEVFCLFHYKSLRLF